MTQLFISTAVRNSVTVTVTEQFGRENMTHWRAIFPQQPGPYQSKLNSDK
jgi:hypothetical protein